MRKKYLLIFMMLLLPQIVLASPNVAISTNESSIEKGKSVTATITLTDSAAWNIKANGSGAASCSTKQADVTSDGKSTTKSFTLSCNSTSEGVITFKVTGDITSGSGETKDISVTKEVTVTKPKSSDNTLSDLKVDGVTISDFSSSKTSYTLKDSTGSSIDIEGRLNDSKATISGTGNKNLKYGKNTFNIIVTAENGSKKTYSIIINKPDSRGKNNYLKELSIDQGSIDFNKNTTSYLVKVDHNINEINIRASAEDSKASVTGTGKKTLKDYINEFKIVVKAENESIKTYLIKVARKDESGNYGKLSTDNDAKSITISNNEFKFNKDIKKYNILVDEDVNDLEFNVTPNDSKASISILNNTNLKPGLNKVTITITAENGDTNEYLFNVYKIGEEKEEEKTKEFVDPPKEEQKDENKEIEPKVNNSNNSNLWLIISFVEFGLIICLIIILLKKKKNNKIISNNDFNNINNQSINIQ